MSADLPLEQLRKHWGYDTFRPLQREAIDCVQAKRDSLVVLPTGGGKSICYQVPALCQEAKLAVVVSPLISLMKDQVDGLVASGISAAALNSSMPDSQKSLVVNQIRRGELRILYVSPERLVQASTIDFLKEAQVGFFAIDEAHCISSWGHDFRPEYRELSKLREHFPSASVHAFTATATQRVRQDIAKQLNLQQAETLVGSFHRPNLNYRVHRRTDAIAQIRQVVDQYPGESGIIYCISRKAVENVEATLTKLGCKARPYHAGLSNAIRAKNQDDFIHEKIDIIVATVAFGMGIDKSSVRYVVHNGMPKSLEAYQQESGRAGRDGLPSECSLLFSGSDLMLWKRMSAGQSGAKELLEAIYGYCTRTGCRHRMLVEYFGQKFEPDNCGACDVCMGEMQTVDEPLILGQKILSCVYRVGQRFGTHHVASVLLGSKAKRILELGHEKLSTYGLLEQHTKQEIVDWTEQLVGQGFLVKVGEYSVLNLTESGSQLLRGEVIPQLFQTSAPPPKPKSKSKGNIELTGVERDLFEDLRLLRRELAQEKQIPPFVIFHDATLRDMACRRPSSTAQFAQIPGVGQKKLADYGELFIERITAWCQSNQVPQDQSQSIPPPVAPAPTPKVVMVNEGMQRAFDLFEQGKSVEQVASEIDRAISTTSGYLSKYIQQQQISDPTRWVSRETAATIRAAAEADGQLERLSPIKTRLGDAFSYEEIRVVVDCLRVETEF